MATPVVIQIVADSEGAAGKIKEFFSGFQNGLNQVAGASQFLGGMAKQLAAAFSVAAIVEFTRRAISNAEEVGKMAQRTGIATETLSELTYAAKLADVDTATLEFGLKSLNRQIAEAANGNKGAAATFESLGVAVKNSDGSLRSTDAILIEVAEKFRGFKDDANKTALAIELFGRSGQFMIPFLNQGAAGINQLRQEARQFGMVISNEASKSAEDFIDNITRLRAILEGLFNTFAQQILPILTAFSQTTVKTVGDTTAMAAAFNGLAYVFKVFAGGLIVVNAGFEELGKRIGWTMAMLPELAQGHLATVRAMNKQMETEIQAIDDRMVDSLDALWSRKPKTIPITAIPTISAPPPNATPDSKTFESFAKLNQAEQEAYVKAQKSARDLENANAEAQYKIGLISLADYFAKRKELIEQGAMEARGFAAIRIDQIDVELRKAPQTPEGQLKANTLLAERAALTAELKILDNKEKQDAVALREEQKQEEQRIAKQNADIEVFILQGKGQKLLAAERQIAEKYAELRRQPGANLDSVNEAERLELVQARVTDQTDRATLSQNTYQQAVQTTNALKESGQITELEAQERNNAAAATYLQTLRMELETLQQITAAYPELTGVAQELASVKAQIVETQASIKDTSFTGTLLDGLRQISNEWGNLGRSMAQWTTGTMRNVFGNLGTYIMDAATKTKTWGQTFTQVGRQIVTSLINILGQYIASKLAMMAIDSIYHSKKKAEDASATAGGLSAGVGQAAAQGGWVGVLIYIAVVAAAMAAMGALAASVSGGFAKGGPVIGDQIARIGEEGPEFVFSAPAVRNLGMDNLSGLHASAREGRIPLNREPLNREPLNREPLNREPLNREPVIQLPRFVMTLADGGPVLSRQIAQIGEAGSEFVFSAPAVRNLGMDNLAGLHAAAREGRMPVNREPLNREPVIQLPRFVVTFADGGPVLSRQIAQIGEAGSEFVFSAPAVQNLGMDYLSGLHASAREGRTMAGGALQAGSNTAGGSGGGGAGGAPATINLPAPQVKVVNVYDRQHLIRELQTADVGDIIYDHINRRRLDLGLSS